MIDNFPEGYFEARKECSSSLLKILDRQLAAHAHMDLTPSDTIKGHLYFCVSVIFFGLPQLFMLASNSSNQQIRENLYRNLIKISRENARIQLGDELPCLRALEDGLISFADLANCPLEMMRILLLPDFQYYLRTELRRVIQKKNDLATQIEQATTDNQKECLRYKKENIRFVMEKLRNSNYSTKSMREIIYDVRGSKLNHEWKKLLTQFENQILMLKAHHALMTQKNAKDKQIFLCMEQLITHLLIAKEVYVKQYHLSHTPHQKMIAAQSLFDNCDKEIRDIKQRLTKEHHAFLNLLENILNTLLFIVTLSASFLITRQFRLFSFQSKNESLAHKMTDSMEKELFEAKVTAIDLHRREIETADLSMSC